MKRKLFNTILLVGITLLFSQCDNSVFEEQFVYNTVVEENFPEESKEFGLAVADELGKTAKNMHRMGFDYSDAKNTDEFKTRFYEDYFNSVQSKSIVKDDIYANKMTSAEFVKRINSLTDIQISFIKRIIEEVQVSSSEYDFSLRIMNINEDIYENVPQAQQERLFNITSTLYYCFKEIHKLERQGLMPPNPQNNMKQLLLKTRSESGNSSTDSYGDHCRRALASTWALAVIEPTFVGEVLATVTMVYVAGVIMYEAIICKDTSYDSSYDSSQDDEERYNYCLERYLNCSSPIPDGCSTCFQYCKVQGSWPPYSTHQCS